jgi:energy-coupling factor transporter transmembrane protein EcfT
MRTKVVAFLLLAIALLVASQWLQSWVAAITVAILERCGVEDLHATTPARFSIEQHRFVVTMWCTPALIWAFTLVAMLGPGGRESIRVRRLIGAALVLSVGLIGNIALSTWLTACQHVPWGVAHYPAFVALHLVAARLMWASWSPERRLLPGLRSSEPAGP